MNTISDFYFSRIAGNKVYNPDGKVIGKLKDLIADNSFARPKIIAAQIAAGSKTLTVDYNALRITKPKNQYRLTCSDFKPFSLEGINAMHLGYNVLDRQIVDVNGRKLVRVNDIRLVVLANSTYVIAADVGIEGLLRRLGVAKAITTILKPLKVTISNHLILWDDVEAINFGHAGIKLNKETSNLNRLHPSDLADILEDMDRNTRIQVFSSLDSEKAADVLEELDQDARENLLESMPLDKMADLLEIMPADEVADILDEISEEKAEELLNEMEDEASDEVRELMEYEDNEVGSLMTTDFVVFKDHNTVDETLRILREAKPESDMIYYLYIVSDEGKLEAIVSLRDLVVALPETKLRDIMKTDIVYVRDEDRIESLNDIISKYNLLAIPVVDANKLMLGMVIINDIVYNLLKSRRKRL
jgi:magnesium transporter